MNLPFAVRLLLWPLSVVYGAYVRLRAWLYAQGWLKRKRLNAIVISVGNLTAGGTGKTPMVLWLAERFLAQGKRVGILSRGYRGAGGTSDEVELLRRRLNDRVAFGVGKNRYAEGRRLEGKGIDIFILDDGFQHLSLSRDVDIVLVDHSRHFRLESLLPAGDLREPVSALHRADIVVITRDSTGTSVEPNDSQSSPTFSANTHLQGFRRLGADDRLLALSEIGPGPFFAFCAIGNPSAFYGDLRRWQAQPKGMLSFRDHHQYSQSDVSRIEDAAKEIGAAALLTTEKDACNLRGARFSAFPVYVSVITMEPDSEPEFLAAIEQTVRARRGAQA